jgi:hypothetical protein
MEDQHEPEPASEPAPQPAGELPPDPDEDRGLDHGDEDLDEREAGDQPAGG